MKYKSGRLLWLGILTLMQTGAFAGLMVGASGAKSTAPLQVAYAGSMGSMMDGGVRPAIAKARGAELQGRASGSSGLANLIVAGSIRPDVFISVTPGPMRAVLKAGKAHSGIPIARTEMVIAYSPKSQYAAALAKAGDPGAKPWWQILETPGLRFGRTDPNTDPQGLNIIFTMQPAALGLPSISLPAEINLGDASMEKEYQQANFTLNGKPHQPSPLVFY